MKRTVTRDIILVFLFGSLIGLNETLLGNATFPYRSVVLNAVSLALLALARHQLPRPGTSLLMVLVALLYKSSSCGLASCTGNAFLCGPTAMLMLGAAFEISALIFPGLYHRGMPRWYMNDSLAIVLASLIAFTAFGILQTLGLGAWSVSRMLEYALLKGFMAGVASALAVSGILFLAGTLDNKPADRPGIIVFRFFGILAVIVLWLVGWQIG